MNAMNNKPMNTDNAVSIFHVCTEISDGGWLDGNVFFTNVEAAIVHLRRHAAYRIWGLRRDGYKVDLLKVWKDHVINGLEESISIMFRANKDGKYEYYDMRIFAKNLHTTADNKKYDYLNWNE